MKKKCSYVARKVCFALFSALWVTLPNQEPPFLTLDLSYLHRCYFPAFLCLFIECIHCWGEIGPLLRNYEPPFSQRHWWLYNGWQSHTHTHELSTYEKSLWCKSCGFIMQMQSRAVAFSANVLLCHLWIPPLGMAGISYFSLSHFMSVWGLGAFGAYLFRTLAVSLVILHI